MNHSKGVKNYYENNTRRFLRFHRDAATKSIHQPLWKEANFTLKEAVFYANELILTIIKNHPNKKNLKIIDLGCGVGSSLFYLENKLNQPANYIGISISETQIDIAQKELNDLPKTNSTFQFITADFTQLPTSLPTIDIAFSIEAFVHASAPEKYLSAISPYLTKGGKLILIDDFLTDGVDTSTLDKKAQKAIADFKYGWMANSLITKTELVEVASNYDLNIIEEEDLTPYMRNNTLKHQWIRFLVVSFRWLYDLLPQKSAYFRSWIGGVGKQYCLRKGIIQYKKVLIEKVS